MGRDGEVEARLQTVLEECCLKVDFLMKMVKANSKGRGSEVGECIVF